MSTTETAPKTSWRITSTRHVEGLNVFVTVDTVAPLIVSAIENAMEANGITFETTTTEADGPH